MEYNKAKANIYGTRIVCGKCGFRIAEYKTEPNENPNTIITVLCRRKDSEGISCNTINEIKA